MREGNRGGLAACGGGGGRNQGREKTRGAGGGGKNHPQGKGGEGPAAGGPGGASPPGIQRMLAHTTDHHPLLPIYKIDPDLGPLIPPKPPELPRGQDIAHGDAPHDPAPAEHEPRAEPARMVATLAARHPSTEPVWMAATLVAREPRAEPAPGAVRAPRPAEAWRDWILDWDAVPNPMGGRTLPLVPEV